MNCRYAYKNAGEDTTRCVMNGWEPCAYSWHCTHEGCEKFYDGWDHCGLALKGARSDDVVWQIVGWKGETAICLNANGRTDQILVPDDGTDRKPDAVVVYGTEIKERWYKPGNEPKVECGKVVKAEKPEIKPLPKKAKEREYKHYGKY